MKRLASTPTPYSPLPTPFLQRLRLLCILLVASLLLSGCLKYDVGIQFESPNQGQIVQRIQLGERLKSLGGTTVQQWLEAIEQRSRRLGGRIERLSDQSLAITIPFSSSADLQTKFNQFFRSVADESSSLKSSAGLPEVASQLTLKQNNFLLFERNWLRYDLDLRSLGILSADGSVLLSPTSLIDLEFRLKTPWGARQMISHEAKAARQQVGQELVWRPVPGELNHLEAVFWLPSPLGIGTLIIIILVIVGSRLKYTRASQREVLSISQPTD